MLVLAVTIHNIPEGMAVGGSNEFFTKCPFEKKQILIYNTATTCGVSTA